MKIKPFESNTLLNEDIENFIAALPLGGIEAQEKRGQSMFVSSMILPKNAPWDKLKKLGFKKLDEYDDIFFNAEIPEGWKKEETDHSMWSHIIDNKGRIRANIFYKAAFYDRSSHLNLSRRFSALMDHDQNQAFVKDCGKIIYRTAKLKYFRQDGDIEYYLHCDKIEEEAIDWLRKKYPDYQNDMAYWD